MGHALIASYGGIPLVYMGDEIALLNDHSYGDDPARAHDSRWLHRPAMDWEAAAAREDGETPGARVFRGIRHILARRAATDALHGAVPTEIVTPETPGVFAFLRRAPMGSVLCMFNFTEHWQHVPVGWVTGLGVTGLHDALSDRPALPHGPNLALPPYARVWLV
jgi:amylosucrase